jgi:uncharacterized protein YneF (UPF0154 family)
MDKTTIIMVIMLIGGNIIGWFAHARYVRENAKTNNPPA